MKVPSVEAIRRLLLAGSLSEVEAERRARMIFEDFNWIGFESLELEARPLPSMQRYCIPAYRFGDTGFSIDQAEQAREIRAEWLGGTGLDRGHLLLFSWVSGFARDLLPKTWLKCRTLQQRLRDPRQHLNTIEEICWLKRWDSPVGIESSKVLRVDANTDVDWQFSVGQEEEQPITVNLEVKRMVGDVVRHARGRRLKIEWFDDFCQRKVLPKFRRSRENEVNVLALSLFGEIDRDVQIVISEWLTQCQDVVDAVLVMTREARRRSAFDLQLTNEKARRLKPFLKPPSSEEESWVFDLVVPIEVPGIPSIVRE